MQMVEYFDRYSQFSKLIRKKMRHYRILYFYALILLNRRKDRRADSKTPRLRAWLQVRRRKSGGNGLRRRSGPHQRKRIRNEETVRDFRAILRPTKAANKKCVKVLSEPHRQWKGTDIPVMNYDKFAKYLGVKFSPTSEIEIPWEQRKQWLTNVKKATLKPEQKIDALTNFIIQRCSTH